MSDDEVKKADRVEIGEKRAQAIMDDSQAFRRASSARLVSLPLSLAESIAVLLEGRYHEGSLRDRVAIERFWAEVRKAGGIVP